MGDRKRVSSVLSALKPRVLLYEGGSPGGGRGLRYRELQTKVFTIGVGKGSGGGGRFWIALRTTISAHRLRSR